MAASASIVDPGQARATRRESSEAHALSNPRFIVRHVRPRRYELVDVRASSTAKSVVGGYVDFESAKAHRDRLNRLYVFFGLAETQLLMSDLIEATARDDADWFEDLVREFDAAYTEATADR